MQGGSCVVKPREDTTTEAGRLLHCGKSDRDPVNFNHEYDVMSMLRSKCEARRGHGRDEMLEIHETLVGDADGNVSEFWLVADSFSVAVGTDSDKLLSTAGDCGNGRGCERMVQRAEKGVHLVAFPQRHRYLVSLHVKLLAGATTGTEIQYDVPLSRHAGPRSRGISNEQSNAIVSLLLHRVTTSISESAGELPHPPFGICSTIHVVPILVVRVDVIDYLAFRSPTGLEWSGGESL